MEQPDAKHPQYSAMSDTWRTCRDCVVGQRAVHAGGERYLPKLGGQTPEAYKAYLRRSVFTGATGRTVEGMTGLVFRRYPTIKLPTALDPFETDINMEGMSLVGLAQAVIEDVLTVGRAGVLVDHPAQAVTEKGAALTVEQAQALGLRPYLTHYKAEAILNWQFGRVNNATKLVRVWLAEQPDDAEEQQIRELRLVEGVYAQVIWRKTGSGWVQVETIMPTMGGKPITEIPFWFCQPKEGRGDVQNAPIESLANVNLSHYMNSADLENGAHIAGQPTPWVNGVDNPKDFPELHLGSDTVLTLPKDSVAGFLQCGAEGFATLEKLMDRKEQTMAALGARMLAPEKREAEAEGTHEIKRGGENSVLATMAAAVETSMTHALRFMARWVGGVEDDASIELNKDYLPTPMDAATLIAWLKAWQAGGISYETFFAGLQRGELVPETASAEEEQEKIASTEPSLGTIGDE